MTQAPALDLELLKKILTDTVDAREPDAEAGGPRFIVDFLTHYFQGNAVTLLPRRRLDHLQSCVEDVIRDRIPGDLLEAGVWRGGAAILMRAVLQAQGVTDRIVWAADSFEGLPTPDAERFPREARAHAGPVMREGFKNLAADLDTVRGNFERFGLLDAQVRFLPGWFENTLPTAPVERLAVLRLDCDFHDSTRQVLVSLYDRLSVGGYLIVDDYGEDEWTHCRQAVDGFRAERGITEPMMRVDRACWYWRRER